MEITRREITISGRQTSVQIVVASDGEVYFKCKDIAKLLGYSDTKDAVRRHVPADNKLKFSEIRGEDLPP